MAVLWPAVYAWELAALPTLPGWSDVAVYDGPPVTGDDPEWYVTVGWVNDPEAGTWQRQRAPSGMEMLEEGDIRSTLTCQTGDVDLASMRTKAFDLINEFAATVEVDRSLGGILPPQSEVSVAATVQSIQNPQGSAQSVTFALHYYAVH